MEAVASDIALKRRAETAILERIESLSAAIINRVPSDYADYSLKAGEIKGLRAALDIIGDIAGQMMGKSPEGRTNG
jgi:hypothetical protein